MSVSYSYRMRNTFITLITLAGFALASGCATAPPSGGGTSHSTAKNEADADAHLVIAEIALQRGDSLAAATEYLAATKASPDVKLAEQATKVAFDNDQETLAAEAARRWLELDSGSVAAHRYLAVTALRLYQLPESISNFQPVLASYATPGEGFMDLANTLSAEDNSYGVLQVTRGLASSHSRLAEAQYAVGSAALRTYDYKLAGDAARKAVALNPKLVEAQRLLARALVVKGEPSEGIDIAKARIAEAPEDIDAKLELVLLLSAAGSESEARDELTKLLDVPEARPDALRSLGALDLSQGKLDDATQRFNDLLSTGRYVGLAFYSLGNIQERRRDSLRAIRYYTRVSAGPLAADSQLRAARLLLATGARDQAIELLDSYVDEHPEDYVQVTIGRSRLMADEGDATSALEVIEQALARYPDNQALQYARSQMLERVDRVDDAITDLRGLVKERPGDPVAMNALGYTLADHSLDLREARSLITKSLDMTPDSPAIQDSMGWVLFKQTQYKDAMKWLTRAYNDDKDAEIAAHLGETLWAMGQQTQARAVWDEALAAEPNHRYLLNTMRKYPD
ncbi:MAG TPA: tetratricopeptide repeat protein [Steroidobacteraceae bacterium]|nr:tetratricopeptide repeat protein [Steroidobacteraceae bacterium]